MHGTAQSIQQFPTATMMNYQSTTGGRKLTLICMANMIRHSSPEKTPTAGPPEKSQIMVIVIFVTNDRTIYCIESLETNSPAVLKTQWQPSKIMTTMPKPG